MQGENFRYKAIAGFALRSGTVPLLLLKAESRYNNKRAIVC